MNERFDIVIIGSGAGGGTVAHALAPSGARIAIVERGDYIPQEEENWSPEAVWKELRYRTQEHWLNGRGRSFRPYMHYCVGGNTKFWGSVLFRLRREDFQAIEHVDGVSPAWPIDYETLVPYYERAERLYHVHGDHTADPTEPPRGPFPHPAVAHAPRMEEIVDGLRRQGLHPSPLPLGLRDHCVYCDTCNSFACKVHAKSDAAVCCIDEAIKRPNVTLFTNTEAHRLITDGRGRRVMALEATRNGDRLRIEASLFVAACGAVNSAALLLRSNDVHAAGLANSSGLVGRRYMAHLATMMQGSDFSRPNDTRFQKTVAINDFYLKGPDTAYPLGQIQSQGRTHPIMAQQAGPSWITPFSRRVPLSWYKRYLTHGVDWLMMSEDLPRADNRVTVHNGQIRLQYRRTNERAHKDLVRHAQRVLRQVGLRFPVPPMSLGMSNTTHQCGTLCFGADPATSVLDPYCRAHDVDNLFVVDGSFFPSAAAVNPGLTIVAQALRVADHIAATDLT